MDSTKSKWDYGEIIAIKYLQKKWYKIKDTNFKFWRFWEIDIICEFNWFFCFIEVKYRINTNYWIPEESITKKKLYKFRKTIEYYIVKNNLDFEKIRFDVITILKWEKSYRLKHYKNLEI
jgi:putative endonuclease